MLFVHVGILIFYSNALSLKATRLARKKYPYVPIGPSGKGFSWDPYIMDEANRLNDCLTIKILQFNIWTVCCFGIAMIGYVLIWLLFYFFSS